MAGQEFLVGLAGGLGHEIRFDNVEHVIEQAGNAELISNLPKGTARFIARHQPGVVVDDVDGETFRRYGGKTMPRLVVVDGTRGAAGGSGFKIVHSENAFSGAAALRRIIDGIGKAAQ